MFKFILVLLFTTMIFSFSVAAESNYQPYSRPAPPSKISANLKELITIVEKNGKNQKLRILIQFQKSKVPIRTDPKTFNILNEQVFIDHAIKTQKSTIPVLNKLKKDGEIREFNSFWVDNVITTIASPKAIKEIAALKDVQEVRVDTMIQDVSSIVDEVPVNSYTRPNYKQ